MPSRRRSSWVWIVAVVVMLAVAYPLSFGPACWIASRSGGGPAPIISAGYRPLIWALIMCPSEKVQGTVLRYLKMGRKNEEAQITLRIPTHRLTF